MKDFGVLTEEKTGGLDLDSENIVPLDLDLSSFLDGVGTCDGLLASGLGLGCLSDALPTPASSPSDLPAASPENLTLKVKEGGLRVPEGKGQKEGSGEKESETSFLQADSFLYLTGFSLTKFDGIVNSSENLSDFEMKRVQKLPDGFYFCYRLSAVIAKQVSISSQVYLGALVNCEKSRRGYPGYEKHLIPSKAFLAFKVSGEIHKILYLGALFNVKEVYFIGLRLKRVRVVSMKSKKIIGEVLNRHAKKEKQESKTGSKAAELVKKFYSLAEKKGLKLSKNWGRDIRLMKILLTDYYKDPSVIENAIEPFFDFKGAKKEKNIVKFYNFMKDLSAADVEEIPKIIQIINYLGIPHTAWVTEIENFICSYQPEYLKAALRAIKRKLSEDPGFIKTLKIAFTQTQWLEEMICRYVKEKKARPLSISEVNGKLMTIAESQCGCEFCKLESKLVKQNYREFVEQQTKAEFEKRRQRRVKVGYDTLLDLKERLASLKEKHENNELSKEKLEEFLKGANLFACTEILALGCYGEDLDKLLNTFSDLIKGSTYETIEFAKAHLERSEPLCLTSNTLQALVEHLQDFLGLSLDKDMNEQN